VGDFIKIESESLINQGLRTLRRNLIIMEEKK